MAFRKAVLGITICTMDFLKDSEVCALCQVPAYASEVLCLFLTN